MGELEGKPDHSELVPMDVTPKERWDTHELVGPQIHDVAEPAGRAVLDDPLRPQEPMIRRTPVDQRRDLLTSLDARRVFVVPLQGETVAAVSTSQLEHVAFTTGAETSNDHIRIAVGSEVDYGSRFKHVSARGAAREHGGTSPIVEPGGGTMEQPDEPAFARRRVEMCFLIDVSGSMATDGKIQSLNTAIEEALPFFRRTAEESVGIEPFVRVLTFGSGVAWNGPARPLEEYWWHPVDAEPNGLTELGPAIALFVAALDANNRLRHPRSSC